MGHSWAVLGPFGPLIVQANDCPTLVSATCSPKEQRCDCSRLVVLGRLFLGGFRAALGRAEIRSLQVGAENQVIRLAFAIIVAFFVFRGPCLLRPHADGSTTDRANPFGSRSGLAAARRAPADALALASRRRVAMAAVLETASMADKIKLPEWTEGMRHACPKVTPGDPGELHTRRPVVEQSIRGPKFGPTSTKLGRLGPNFGWCWSKLTKLWQTSTNKRRGVFS